LLLRPEELLKQCAEWKFLDKSNMRRASLNEFSTQNTHSITHTHTYKYTRLGGQRLRGLKANKSMTSPAKKAGNGNGWVMGNGEALVWAGRG